ncbi:hypothetical protein ACGFYA_29170 [Streptomyces sp. NPDC048305]|uniref:hypothetical protein n=1 Tax=Streptomyces sp. NPDC048305 TaxID=3365532 RepID=UPI00370FD568
MSYADEVKVAIVPLLALQEQFQCDLSMEWGGFEWWQDYQLTAGRRILISDYLMSLPFSVETNLVEAVMHARQTKQLRYADGAQWRQRIRLRTGKPPWGGRTERDEDRGVEIGAHIAGFFRCVGSVVDNLAGLVVGVAGLRTPITRADVGRLRFEKQTPSGLCPEGPGREEQLKLVLAMKNATATGPNGWWQWTDDMRNTLVHRARRVEPNMYDEKADPVMVRPLPRHPKQTDAEARARAGRPLGEFLDEDADVTIAGILDAVIEMARATAVAAVATWDERRRDPQLILQPAEQWPTMKQGLEVPFAGCNPTELPPQRRGTILAMNPNRTRRLQAGKLMDADLHVWSEWLNQ